MSDYRTTRAPEDLDPELKSTAQALEEAASRIVPDPAFTSGLEHRLAASYPAMEVRSMPFARKLVPALLIVLATAALIVVVEWMIRSLAPQPVPALRGTPVPSGVAPLELTPTSQPTPVKSSTSYDWRGVSLSVAAALPDAPDQTDIYLGQPDAHATLEDAAALAQRFGIQGAVYETRGELPGTTDYVVTDGKQSLRVRSSGYLEYVADVAQAYNYFAAVQEPNADQRIGAFLESHGYAFPHMIEWSELRGGYNIAPLAGDGTPLRYEFYGQPMMFVSLAPDGSVLRLQTNLLNMSAAPAGRVGIISAEQALQRLLDANRTTGVIESMHSAIQPMHQWNRSYPLEQTLTFYGYVTSLRAADPAQPPFIQLDGFPATGETRGLDQFSDSTYVAATGHFVQQNDALWFSIDSWKMPETQENSFVGLLRSENGQLLLTTQDGQQLSLPDAPADLPLPFENAFVVGTTIGDRLEWKLIDNRMASTGGGGGGGGGGGSGFWKLNLSGTPVPFPTQAPAAVQVPGGAQYTVQAGDTLGSIAAANNVTVDSLLQANNLGDGNALMVGQALVIPAQITQKVEALRGSLNITITRQPGGSTLTAYGFLPLTTGTSGGYMLLEGTGLEALQAYNSRPVDIWGILRAPSDGSIPTLQVERFEIPFPDLKVEALRGKQQVTQIDGNPATLFTSDDGQTYIQLVQDGTTGSSLIGSEGAEVLLEAVAIPGESFAGHPTLRVFGGMLAVDPKSGLHVSMPITMDQPMVVESTVVRPLAAPVSATIETIRLEHFLSDPRYAASQPANQPLYFQPVWRFSGHYDNGDSFEVLIQATREEFLLPELEPALQPG